MRLIRWVEGRLSGRKSRLKDGSTTSADDQFVYHPSPFRQQSTHVATPAHLPPKLDHQLEQRLNEQIKQRLSGHFVNCSRNDVVHLRRTTSALESRSNPRKLINNRINEYNAIDKRHTQYDELYDAQYNNQFNAQYDKKYDLPFGQQFNGNECPNSLVTTTNLFNNELGNRYEHCGNSYENGYQNEYRNHQYQNEYLNEFETEVQPIQQTDPNRYSSITHTSNESAFFDCNSPSLAIDSNNTPSLGKQRSRIKTNPWLPSPWMSSSSSITNSTNSETNNNNNNKNQLTTIEPNRSNRVVERLNYDAGRSVRTSYSFASTLSSDSGCNVNTNSIDASVLSANHFMNESLMSCSLITNNSLVDDDEEQILTITHRNGADQMVANQMNVKHYIQQMNSIQIRSAPSSNSTNIPLSSTLEDFGEMSSRAESQLSAIYQQIDELKSKINEIDSDNGRIEAKMNSLVSSSQKVNVGMKSNLNSRDNYSFDHFIPSSSSSAIKSSSYKVANSSEEEIVTSSSYSPASSSSLASSPVSVQNSSMKDHLIKEINNNNKSQPQQPTSSMTSSVSFNSTTTPSSCWSLASICSSQNIQAQNCSLETTKGERNSLNMSTIDEHKVINDSMELSNNNDNNNGEQLDRVFDYLKQNDQPFNQLKYRNNVEKLLLNASGRRRSLNSKFVNLRKSLVDSSDLSSNNRLSNCSLKSGCNEAWVSTTTDLLASSDDEEETLNYVNFVNNQILKSKKLESKNFNELKNDNKLMLLSDSTSYNSKQDAYNICSNEISNQKTKSQILKPLTPIKVNENYKRLKPINGSKIPVMMKPIIESESYSPTNNPPSPAPLDRHVNRINEPIRRNLPKPKTFLQFNKKAKNYNDYSDCLVSPLTQQLRFERQSKQYDQQHWNYGQTYGKQTINQLMNHSPKQINNNSINHHMANYYPNNLLSPPPVSSDSGYSESHSDNSPLVEQAKNQTLAYQIQNLRLELRDKIKMAINEVKKDKIF